MCRYYFRKLGADFDDTALARMKRSYLEGLNWVLGYYYQGCQSWNWFYPYHYAPLASDMCDLPALGDCASFELGRPFLPFQQLLGVLPPLSSALLPAPYRSLMTNPASPVYEFFTEEIKLDMEGKSYDWEAVVLLSFMEEEKLLAAVDMVRPEQLTPEERYQNIRGAEYCFRYDPSILAPIESPIPSLGDIPSAPVRIEPYTMPPFPPGVKFLPALCDGVSLGRNCIPGWPNVRSHYLALQSELTDVGVNVFGRPSQRASVLIEFGNEPAPGVEDAEDLPSSAAELIERGVLGSKRWANFPFLVEAMVVGVCDGQQKFAQRDGPKSRVERPLSAEEKDQWEREAVGLSSVHRIRWGLDPGVVECTLDLRLFTGMKVGRGGLGTEKVFDKEVVTVPYQLTLPRPPQEDPRFVAVDAAAPLEQHFPADAKLLYLEAPYCGAPVTVKGVDEGMVVIEFEYAQGKISDDFAKMVKALKPPLYFPMDFVAKKLKLDFGVLSRVLSVVPLVRVKDGDEWKDGGDLGLQLKFEKRNLGMPGFTQRHPSGKGWQVSVPTVQILTAYKEQFPEVFKALRANQKDFELDPKKIFAGQDHTAKVMQVQKFLAALPTAKLPLVPATARCYDTETIAAIEAHGDAFTKAKADAKQQSLTRRVSPKSVVGPALLGAAAVGNTRDWQLSDRVISRKDTGQVPFGLRGTVVGFSEDNAQVEVVFDAPFLGGDALRGRCTDGRCAAATASMLLSTGFVTAWSCGSLSSPSQS